MAKSSSPMLPETSVSSTSARSTAAAGRGASALRARRAAASSVFVRMDGLPGTVPDGRQRIMSKEGEPQRHRDAEDDGEAGSFGESFFDSPAKAGPRGHCASLALAPRFRGG